MRGLLVALALIGCTRPPTPKHAAPPEGGPDAVARCAWSGTLEIGAGTQLFANATSLAPRARLTGNRVGVRVRSVARRVEVTLSSPASGPAMHLDGFLPLEDVPLVAAEDLVLVPAHAWISAGAPIAVRGMHEDRVTVEAHTIQGFEAPSRDVACDAIAIGRPHDLAVRAPANASPFHLVTSKLDLLDVDGGVVATWSVHDPEMTTLFVVETASDRSHVRLDDWIRLDAWVRTSSIAPGEGADCDDCRGSVLDVDDLCYDDDAFVDDDGCPKINWTAMHARRDAKVRATPSAAANVIGRIDEGAALLAFRRENGFARVVPKDGGFASAGDDGLWVSLDDLDP